MASHTNHLTIIETHNLQLFLKITSQKLLNLGHVGQITYGIYLRMVIPVINQTHETKLNPLWQTDPFRLNFTFQSKSLITRLICSVIEFLKTNEVSKSLRDQEGKGEGCKGREGGGGMATETMGTKLMVHEIIIQMPMLSIKMV